MIEDWSTYLWDLTIIMSCLFLFKILYSDIIRTDARHESEPDLGNTGALATVFTTAYTKTRSWNEKRRWKIKIKRVEKSKEKTVSAAYCRVGGEVELWKLEMWKWRDPRIVGGVILRQAFRLDEGSFARTRTIGLQTHARGASSGLWYPRPPRLALPPTTDRSLATRSI